MSKASSIFAIRVVILSPIIFEAREKEDFDATVDTCGVSRSHAILDNTGKVDSWDFHHFIISKFCTSLRDRYEQ